MIGEETEKQRDAVKGKIKKKESICLTAEGGFKTPHGLNTI